MPILTQQFLMKGHALQSAREKWAEGFLFFIVIRPEGSRVSGAEPDRFQVLDHKLGDRNLVRPLAGHVGVVEIDLILLRYFQDVFAVVTAVGVDIFDAGSLLDFRQPFFQHFLIAGDIRLKVIVGDELRLVLFAAGLGDVQDVTDRLPGALFPVGGVLVIGRLQRGGLDVLVALAE